MVSSRLIKCFRIAVQIPYNPVNFKTNPLVLAKGIPCK